MLYKYACIYTQSYKGVYLELPYTGDNVPYRKAQCQVWHNSSLSYCSVVFWRYPVQSRLLTLLLLPTRICGQDPTAEDTTHFGHTTQRNQVGADPGSFLTIDQLSYFWKMLSGLLEKKKPSTVLLRCELQYGKTGQEGLEKWGSFCGKALIPVG